MIIATEGRGKKLALITERFSTYMDPLYRVSKGKTGEADSGKTDYRNPLVSKLTRLIAFSYVDSDMGFGIPRYP